jgi:hypothetical protein
VALHNLGFVATLLLGVAAAVLYFSWPFLTNSIRSSCARTGTTWRRSPQELAAIEQVLAGKVNTQ